MQSKSQEQRETFKIDKSMKKKYVRNEHGINIKVCCASCKLRKIESDEGHVCGLNDKEVKACHRCKHWEMSRRLQNAGMSGGRIKSWRYLTYYRERWIAQREALIAGKITANEMLTVEDIRREYEQEFGSIYINF